MAREHTDEDRDHQGKRELRFENGQPVDAEKDADQGEESDE